VEKMHSLLRRQIRRHFGSGEAIPPGLHDFLELVNAAYEEFDIDREMLERSLDLSSQELLQTNSEMRAVFESFPDLFFRLATDGSILDHKVGSIGDLFLKEEDLLGKRIQDIPLKDVASIFQDALDRVRRERELVTIEYPLMVNGEHYFYEARFFPLPVGEIFVIVRNITERKRGEKAREREKELQARLARAERMESLGLLAGGVAHELNNILGPVVAYPDIMLSEMPADSRLREDLIEIRDSSQCAAAVILDLLTLARRGAHRTNPVHLNEVIQNCLNAAAFGQLKDSHPHVSIEVKLHDEELRIMGSAPHLTQVFMNLLLNAFEAMPHGGNLRISTLATYLDRPVGAYDEIDEGDYVVLSVKDSGSGIADEDIERVFEPFYTSKKMGRSGSGLGLAVVYGVVKDFEGYIDVQSELGQGTEFNLYFPVSRDIRDEPEEVPVDCTGTESILVVDDVERQRTLADRALSKLGYQVTAVADGHEAIRYFGKHTPDLVVLDMIMEEEFDGLDTYREIVRIAPGQPCIISSGFSENNRVREAQKLGAGMYVRKPYTLEKIGRAVRAVLDNASSASEGDEDDGGA